MAGAMAAGIYRPGHAAGESRRAGPDEDLFTLGAAAVELLPASTRAGTTRKVELVGDFPPVAEWGFGVLLDSAVTVRSHPATAEGLPNALRAAASAREPSVVVVAQLDPAAAPLPDNVGAVALAFAGGGGEATRASAADAGTEGSALQAALRLAEGVPDVGRDDRALLAPGDPAADVERWDRFRGTSTLVVSEGAYVPGPRYRENLPSRWNLVADRCASCGGVTFPTRGACRHCGRSDRLTRERLPRDGATVVARTTIGKGGQPTEFDAQVAALGDYGVVLAEWPGGVRVTLPVTDSGVGWPKIGDPIRTRLRRLYPMDGEWRYGRKAVPPSGST